MRGGGPKNDLRQAVANAGVKAWRLGPLPYLAVMAPKQRSTTDDLITQARHERERLRQAELWAHEVLGRIASEHTAVSGTNRPSAILTTVIVPPTSTSSSPDRR